ncbi:hypothetical protein V8C40DRAFT_86897 [Trichoderma camerunense]
MAAPTLLFRDHAGSGHHLVSGMHDIGQIKHPSKAACVREPVQMALVVNLDVKVTGNLPDFVGLGSSQKSQGLESLCETFKPPLHRSRVDLSSYRVFFLARKLFSASRILCCYMGGAMRRRRPLGMSYMLPLCQVLLSDVFGHLEHNS